MSNFLSLRLYRVLLIITVVIIGVLGVIAAFAAANRFGRFDLLLFFGTLMTTVIAVVGILVVIDVLSLLLEVHENTGIARAEAERAGKTQREILKQLQGLSQSVDYSVTSVQNAVLKDPFSQSSKPTISVSPVSETVSGVQARARVKGDKAELYATPNGDIATGVSGGRLSVIQGQGIFLTARSADAIWYRFSPDRVVEAWIKADDLQLIDVDKLDSLPSLE